MSEKTLKRKQLRLALCEEFNHDYDAAARAAMERGMYSKSTNLGDIAAALSRTWVHRDRDWQR